MTSASSNNNHNFTAAVATVPTLAPMVQRAGGSGIGSALGRGAPRGGKVTEGWRGRFHRRLRGRTRPTSRAGRWGGSGASLGSSRGRSAGPTCSDCPYSRTLATEYRLPGIQTPQLEVCVLDVRRVNETLNSQVSCRTRCT